MWSGCAENYVSSDSELVGFSGSRGGLKDGRLGSLLGGASCAPMLSMNAVVWILSVVTRGRRQRKVVPSQSCGVSGGWEERRTEHLAASLRREGVVQGQLGGIMPPMPWGARRAVLQGYCGASGGELCAATSPHLGAAFCVQIYLINPSVAHFLMHLAYRRTSMSVDIGSLEL